MTQSYAINANYLSTGNQSQAAKTFIFGNQTTFSAEKTQIIFSDAFKRLANKCQVYDNRVGSNGHKYRTRLTHTLEVAEISKQVAKCLGLNAELAENLALLHDIGHAPFGHQGQDALDEVLSEATNGKERFEHNNQALRLLTLIEPMGISTLTLNGLRKRKEHGLNSNHNYGESQVMNVVDAICYVAGDVEDALNVGNLDTFVLMGNPFMQSIMLKDGVDNFSPANLHQKILSYLATDLIEQSLQNFEEHKLVSYYQFLDSEKPLISFSDKVYQELKEFKKFLKATVYENEEMLSNREEQKMMLKTIFHFFIENFDNELDNPILRIGNKYTQIFMSNTNISKERIVTDYIAGCDDKYIQEIYNAIKAHNF